MKILIPIKTSIPSSKRAPNMITIIIQAGNPESSVQPMYDGLSNLKMLIVVYTLVVKLLTYAYLLDPTYLCSLIQCIVLHTSCNLVNSTTVTTSEITRLCLPSNRVYSFTAVD